MAGDESNDIEADWVRWLTPKQAIQTLVTAWDDLNGFSAARTELLSRLRDGLLIAAAEHFVAKKYGREEERGTHRLVTDAAWRQVGDHVGSQFWKTGLLEVEGSTGAQKVTFYGIRFDPDQMTALIASQTNESAVQATAPTPEPPTGAKATRHGMPALNDDLLGAWYELFLRAYPDGTKGMAEESAKGMFPKHSVDRQKVRDLFGPASRGRPLKNKPKI